MCKKPLLALLSSFLIFSVMLHAQDQTGTDATPTAIKGDSAGPNRFWQATLAGGHYMIALDRITSISRHKYVLDGSLIVDEVTIDSVGQALARFYFIRPITDAMDSNVATQLADQGKELIDKVAKRGGTEVQNMVVKKYPETTHAKSIEYRLLTEGELGSLYDSVRNSWESGKGRKFSTSAK
ncbi:MAG: hypothetical protein ABI600_02330 [Luteolibacter sp.]